MGAKIVIPLIAALLAAFWFAVGVLLRKKSPGILRQGLIGGTVAIAIGVTVVVVLALEKPITAVIAIPLFVATILEFGLLIALASRMLSGRISRRTFMVGVLTIIAIILIGVVLMFQPATPVIFNLGFDFVLIALLAFNVWNHITPRPEQRK